MSLSFVRVILILILPILNFGCFGVSSLTTSMKPTVVAPTPIIPAVPKVVSKIIAGNHTCVTHDQGMDCWGLNQYGALGPSHLTSSIVTPFSIVNNEVIDDVAIGSYHTCFVQNGGVKCSGGGTSGELGNAANSNSTSFVEAIPVGSGVTKVAAGGYATCAIKNGGLFCWGSGGNFQIGDGTVANRNSPTQIFAEGSGVTQIALGDFNTCAIVATELWCWGRNWHGQVGDGTLIHQNAPVKIAALGAGIDQVKIGERHVCAIKNGGLFCWGYNLSGQLGDNSVVAKSTPTAIYPATSGVSEVNLGSAHTCALVNQELFCWGSNYNGQLNDPVLISNRLTPTLIFDSTKNISEFSIGGFTTCIVGNHQKIECWGSGTLGNGAYGNSTMWPSPENVLGLANNVQKLAKVDLLNDDGNYQNCSIHNGGVKCWGTNSNGILGDGTVNASRSPVVAIAELSGVTDLAVIAGTSNASSCAVVNGGVQCWGAGYGTSPVQIIPAASNVTAITLSQYGSFGDDYACAVVDGGVQCWGVNSYGQLGNGTTVSSLIAPVTAIAAASGVTKVSIHGGSSCAVVAGGLSCWGWNDSGQLGDGTSTQRNSPVVIFAGGSGVTDVFLISDWHQPGQVTTCAIVNGGLKCWGKNSVGLVGDGTTNPQLSPIDIFPAASGVTKVFGWYQSLCALKNSGLYCWGRNFQGGLGVGDKLDRNVPTLIIAEGSGVTDFAVSYSAGCAVFNSGLKCWGENTSGSVGDGTTLERLTPVTIYEPGSNVQEVAFPFDGVTCIRINDSEKCWGTDYSYGLIGNGKVARGLFNVVGFP